MNPPFFGDHEGSLLEVVTVDDILTFLYTTIFGEQRGFHILHSHNLGNSFFGSSRGQYVHKGVHLWIRAQGC